MEPLEPLIPDQFFLIHNTGNHTSELFIELRNYFFFLQLYQHHIQPIAETWAFTLQPYQFHFLIRIRSEEDLLKNGMITPVSNIPHRLSRRFANLFNGYAKAFNKTYGRTGSLFRERFRRNTIGGDDELRSAICQVHWNAQIQKITDNFETYSHSSYQDHLAAPVSFLQTEGVMELFGGSDNYVAAHRRFDYFAHLERHGPITDRLGLCRTSVPTFPIV